MSHIMMKILRMIRKTAIYFTAILLFMSVPIMAFAGMIRDTELETGLQTLMEPLVEAAGYPPNSIAIRIIIDPNYNAFVATDQAANGRLLLVPEGIFHITRGLSLSASVQIQGRLLMPDDAPLVLSKSYNLSTYIDAFKSEELAFKKAFQALLNSGDHDSLDLSGRTIAVTEPIDMQAAVANRTEYAQRRVIRNGQFYAQGDNAWENEVVNSLATYDQNTPKVLKNVAAQEVTLSEALFDADGTQNFSFTRFKYLLDFSGFEKLSKFSLQNIEFQCNSKASGIMLALTGYIFHI